MRSASTVPSGNLAKASSVGARIVYGPFTFSIDAVTPVASAAARRVVNTDAETARS